MNARDIMRAAAAGLVVGSLAGCVGATREAAPEQALTEAQELCLDALRQTRLSCQSTHTGSASLKRTSPTVSGIGSSAQCLEARLRVEQLCY